MAKKTEDKTVSFISKLVQLTEEGSVKWWAVGSQSQDSEAAFETNVEGKTLRIYRYSKVSPNPEYATYTSGSVSVTSFSIFPSHNLPPPKTIIKNEAVMEVVDLSGRAVYRF